MSSENPSSSIGIWYRLLKVLNAISGKWYRASGFMIAWLPRTVELCLASSLFAMKWMHRIGTLNFLANDVQTCLTSRSGLVLSIAIDLPSFKYATACLTQLSLDLSVSWLTRSYPNGCSFSRKKVDLPEPGNPTKSKISADSLLANGTVEDPSVSKYAEVSNDLTNSLGASLRKNSSGVLNWIPMFAARLLSWSIYDFGFWIWLDSINIPIWAGEILLHYSSLNFAL